MSEGVMSSFVQNNSKERKSPVCVRTYVKLSSPCGHATAEKDSPRRPIIELKELIVDGVDGIDDNNVVVVASAASESIDNDDDVGDDGDGNKRITQCNSANSGDCAARCQSLQETETNCGIDATKVSSPESSGETVCSSANACSSVTSNHTKCDSSDDTNNKENSKQKVRASASAILFLLIFFLSVRSFGGFFICRDEY